MDTRTGNLVDAEEMKEMIKTGQRLPSDFMKLDEASKEHEHPETPAYQPKSPGATIEFPGGIVAQVISAGQLFMTCQMVGKRELKPSAIGKVLTLSDNSWQIKRGGRTFLLKKMTEKEIKLNILREKHLEQKEKLKDNPKYQEEYDKFDKEYQEQKAELEGKKE